MKVQPQLQSKPQDLEPGEKGPWRKVEVWYRLAGLESRNRVQERLW